VNIVHAVDNDPSDFLKTLIGTHCRHGISLYEDVALGQELDGLLSALQRDSTGTYLEGTPVRPDYPLTTFHESLLVSNQSSNLDYIACDIVLKDLDCLPISLEIYR
jgi:hypothetical protein